MERQRGAEGTLGKQEGAKGEGRGREEPPKGPSVWSPDTSQAPAIPWTRRSNKEACCRSIFLGIENVCRIPLSQEGCLQNSVYNNSPSLKNILGIETSLEGPVTCGWWGWGGEADRWSYFPAYCLDGAWNAGLTFLINQAKQERLFKRERG